MDSLNASPIPRPRGGVDVSSHNVSLNPAERPTTVVEELRADKEEQARWRAVKDAFAEPALVEVPRWLAALEAKKAAQIAQKALAQQEDRMDARTLGEVLRDSLSNAEQTKDARTVPVLTEASSAWMRSLELQQRQRRDADADVDRRQGKPFNAQWLSTLRENVLQM